jgi:hypothetical protein
MTRIRTLASLFASLTFAVAGCGGGADGSIGGTVSGLNANTSVGLQDNGVDALTVGNNGSFQFPTALQPGISYSVTIVAEPAGESCVVAGGSGTIDTSDDAVDTVSIVCTTLLSLSGTVSGLAPGTSVTLSDGQVLLPIATNGTFSFPGTVTPGTSYAITIATPPAGETCTVVNGSGSVTAAGIPAIVVTCS